MADAEVGDDFYTEDPTINRLQDIAAERFGMEAALLCPSGVMCNQLWLRVLARPGDEVLLEADAHIVNFEGGAGAALGGVQFKTVVAPRGVLTTELVAPRLRPNVPPFGGTALIAVEQTNNLHGGTCYSVAQLDALGDLARDHRVSLYCDGARIFNAAIALDVPVARLAAPVDGLMFCLSKALSAPVGSIMVGSAEAITEARVWRARYGGAMRQAGVIAAAGLVALDDMVDRLADDHANAKLLATYVAEADSELVDPDAVETNIVAIPGVRAHKVVDELAGHGVRAVALNSTTLRLVTHPDVSSADCKRAGQVLQRVIGAPGARLSGAATSAGAP